MISEIHFVDFPLRDFKLTFSRKINFYLPTCRLDHKARYVKRTWFAAVGIYFVSVRI